MRPVALALTLLLALIAPAAHAGGAGKKAAPRTLMSRLRRTGARATGGLKKKLLGRTGGAGGHGAGLFRRPTSLGGTRARTLRVPKLARRPQRSPRPPKRTILVRKLASRPRVAEASVSGLTVAGVGGMARSTATAAPRLSALGGIAGAVLIVTSIAGLTAADAGGTDRADSAHGLAWGMQSLGELVGGGSTLTTALGVGGGAIQTAVGVHRVRTGLKQKDRKQVILGSLDVVAGAAWVASATTGNPITAGVFLAATAARVGYANAAELKALPGQIAGLARRVAARVRGGGGGRGGGRGAGPEPVVTPL